MTFRIYSTDEIWGDKPCDKPFNFGKKITHGTFTDFDTAIDSLDNIYYEAQVAHMNKLKSIFFRDTANWSSAIANLNCAVWGKAENFIQWSRNIPGPFYSYLTLTLEWTK